MTASSDQTCYLWDCQDVSKYHQEMQISKDSSRKNRTRPSVARSSLKHSSIAESYSVTCADWSTDGKMLAIGKVPLNTYFYFDESQRLIIIPLRTNIRFFHTQCQETTKETFMYGHPRAHTLIPGNLTKE